MTEQDAMLLDQWSGDSSATTITAGAASPWWQDTLDFVVRAAAVDRYTPKPVQGANQYQFDRNGNLVPMGAAVPYGAQPVGNNMMMFAALAVGAVLLFSMAKG